MAKPAWDHVPPFQRPLDAIVRVLPGRRDEYLILSSQITGLWTHYIGPARRSYPCTGEQGECLYDHRYTSRRWQGWLAVQKPFERIVRYLCLTATACRDNPRLWETKGGIRGYQLWVGRSGADTQTRMYALLGFEHEDKRKLLAEPNVRNFLVNLFGSPMAWPHIRTDVRMPDLSVNADWWDAAVPAGECAE